MPTSTSASSAPARSHTARVVEGLGLAIVSGQMEQGQILPGDGELMQAYDVSRTVIREALKTLAGKGLIQPKARVGTRVRDREGWNLFDHNVLVWHARSGLSAEFLDHLGEIRMALEPEGAALAARRRTKAQLDEMHEWVAALSAPGIAPRARDDAVLGLHLAISRAAGNPFMLSVSTLIEVALTAMLTIVLSTDDPAVEAGLIDRHRAIVAAIEGKDAEAARTAMRVMIEAGMARARDVRSGSNA